MDDAPPDFVAARDHVVATVVGFARTLRANGASVPANAALDAAAALATVGLDDRDRVRAATHATLIRDPRDDEAFETQFPAFWHRLRTGLEATATADPVGDRGAAGSSALYAREGDAADAESEFADPDAESDDARTTDLDDADARHVAGRDGPDAVASERDDDRTLSGYSAAGEGSVVEDARTGSVERAAIRRFERALATLAGRRWTRGAGAVDARRALRASVGTGGVPLSLPTRDRKPSAFRCCVVVDVSRSVLDTVDEGFLLAALDSLVDAGRSVRVFFFDTDIREVTAVFEESGGDPAAALERAAVQWGGGTRIGDSLATLRERWPDAVDRRTATLVVSDGLDVGEADRLERAMAWLAGRSGTVLWLNPLAASPAYEPTARGMAAALPYVDGLFAFASAADLDEAARQLERHGSRGPVGYEYDGRERATGGEPTG